MNNKDENINVLSGVVRLQHAANCALWLLNQKELSHLFEGDWGDPVAIKEMLEDIGCVPNCEYPLSNHKLK